MSFPCFTNKSWSSCYKTFTLSFTITNMFYTTKMSQKDSRTFKTAEHILQVLLKVLFRRSRLGSQYYGCSGISLRSLKNNIATAVNVLCIFKKDSSKPVVNKKKVYWELTEQLYRRNLKHLVIENDSLFVNGYHYKLPGIRSTKMPVTHIPDHGASEDIESLTSGLLIRESTLCAIGLSAESKGRIRTRAGKVKTTTTCSPAVRTHSVLATITTPTTPSGTSFLERITVPASSALPETMVAPAAWSGVISPSKTVFVAEISTPPVAGTGGGSPIGVPSNPATHDTTASTTFFPLTNVLPAGSTSTSATSLSSVSREDPKPMTSLDTVISETTAMTTAKKGLALTDSTATMDNSRGSETVVLSTSDLPTTSASPLIITNKVSTGTTMTTIADTAAGSSYSKIFTLNFTITNLFYTTKMGHRDSGTFKAAENVIKVLLKSVFAMTNLGSHYSGCSVILLRPLKNGTATGVDVLCTCQEDSSNPVLDKEKVYWELSEQIYRRNLRHLLIERDSLFVDGYNHKIPGIRSTNRPSAESKGRIMTTAGEPETIMTTTSSPAVRTHSVLATTVSTTASDIDLEKITLPASSALPETMVAPAAWSGVEMSPSETMFIAEGSTLPGTGTEGGSPIGVPSHPATHDTTASTTAFPWTNVLPAGSTSTSATSLSSVSREDPKPMTSLDTSASETTAMATAMEEPALTESTVTMNISRGAEAVVLSTSDLPTSSAVPLIPTDKVSTRTTMTTIADTGLDAVNQPELSEIQSPQIVTEFSQKSDAGFPLSSTATEATGAMTITSSTLLSGLGESQSSIGSISGTEAIGDSPTLFSSLESTSPEYELSTEEALSTLPTEKLLEMVSRSLTIISKMPSNVTASASRTNLQGLESQRMSALEANDDLAVGTGPGVTFTSPISKGTSFNNMDIDVETASKLAPWSASSSSQVEASSPDLVVTTGDEPSLGIEPHNPIHESLSPRSGFFPALSTSKTWTSTASLEAATSLEDPGPAGLNPETERNPQATPNPAITLPPASTEEVCTTASPSPPDTTTEGSSVQAGTASISDEVPSTSGLFPSGDAVVVPVTRAQSLRAPRCTVAPIRSPLTPVFIPTGNEIAVGPITYIPDHGEPGDMTSVTSGLLTYESTLGAMAISATETTPDPDLSMRHTTLEPGSDALPSTAPSIIPTPSGEDTNTPLLPIEGPAEDKTESSTFSANSDTPAISQREHIFFTGPGVTFQPDMTSTSLLNLSEGTSYSRTIPSPSLGSRKSTAIIGVWTSPAEPLTPEPKKPTSAEGSFSVGPVTEFSSRESGHLQNSLAPSITPEWETSRPGTTTESDISTLIPGNFHPSGGTADLMSSPVEGSSPKPAVYTSPPHTTGTTGTRLGGETDSYLVLTTPAPAVSISSISGALLGTRTVVPWSSNSAEATDLTMNRLDPISMLPSKFSTSSPVTFSGVTYKDEDKSSNVPGTDSISVIFSSKVTDRVSLHPEITPNQNLLGTMEESTGALLTPSLPGPPGSSAATMGGVLNMSGTTPGSTPQVTLAYEILTRDLEKTSDFPLAMENTTKSVPAKMMGDTSMASMSPDSQVSSALHLTTTSRPVTLPGQSIVLLSSTIAEAGALTLTGTDSTPTWQSTHSSTTITSSKVTPMTKNMRPAPPRTDSMHLISSTKIIDVVPFPRVFTLSHELLNSVVENNTDAPLTTPKSPVLSDTCPGGSLVTSADSAVLGTTAHGEPRGALEKDSTLSVNTFTTKIRENTVTAKVIEGSTLAPPRINTGAEGRSSIPFATNLGEIQKSSKAVTPRDTSPSSLWPAVTTATPFDIGSSLDDVTQAELSEIQSPLIITEVPQKSEAGFPLNIQSQSISTLEASDAVGTAPTVTFVSPLPNVTASSSMDVDVETVSRLAPWTASSSSQVEVSSPNLVVTTGDGPSLGTEPHTPIHESLSPGPGLSTPKAWTSTASLEAANSLEDPGPAGLTLESERNPQATPNPAITLPPANTQEFRTTASPSPSDTTTEGSSVKAGTASVSDQVPSTSSLFPRGNAGVEPVTHSQSPGAPGTTVALIRSPLTPVSTIMPTASESSYLKVFNLKFTILNLFYIKDMGQRGSSKFNSIEDGLQHLINSLFRKNSFGSHYFGCRLTLLRSMKNRTATGVDVDCAYHEDYSIPVLDREKIYWELSEQTHGITRLGPYMIDNESLYVDGYNHLAVAPTKMPPDPAVAPGCPLWATEPGGSQAASLSFQSFTTIPKVLYTEDMHLSGSDKFNSTNRILQRLMKNGSESGVSDLCTHRRNPRSSDGNQEKVHWELSNKKKHITKLGLSSSLEKGQSTQC
ncbi:mucin-16-like isoform X1 [Monodelphis domestica]|uniref:mucin-16-like isoform X1 n=1 Tax=Monodelphis domestica TaxID=13616 RepID=UPI0024E229E0|nr:mucin-16-like isoform X1 [Monodelphis domestica]